MTDKPVGRTCTRCQQAKASDEFYQNKRALDGLHSWCKECSKAVSREYKRRNPEIRRAQDRSWRERNPDKVRAYKRKYKQKHRDVILEKRYEYEKSDPAKPKAWHAVHKAIKSGRLVRPEQCSDCRKQCLPDAHHTDYSKRLDVVWLCEKCHRKAHRMEGAPLPDWTNAQNQEELEALTAPEPKNEPETKIGTNTGHGHVWERPDGVRARCGGPGLCAECSRDFAKANR